jgi:predicted CoA-binding protein
MNLTTPQTIAIIGLSDKPDRPSYQVAHYLLNRGYNIIPVNPNIKTVFNHQAYPDISAVPDNISIDIVNIFRQPDQIIGIINEVIATGRRPVIWIQEKFDHPDLDKLAQKYQLEIINGICLMRYHQSQS